MKFLTRIEEILLVAIWKLDDEAYGMAIREQVHQDTGVKWASGMIYGSLSRLLKNDLVTDTKGEATPERGGRHKIYYSLTQQGREKLAEIQRVNQSLWSDMPSVSAD